MANIQNAFRLTNTQVTHLSLTTEPIDINNKNATGELDLDLQHQISFNHDDSNEFFVTFRVLLKSNISSFVLEITMVASFLTKETITEDFKNSDFLKISAPAIAFPFVRSFVATITTNAGYDAVVFPPFNFVS